MKTTIKLLPFAIWLVIGIAVFLLTQYYFEFHFYYVEQLQLFLYDKKFLSDLFLSFGGLSELISRWILQFYIHPKAGAFITAVLLFGVVVLMNGIARKINKNVSLILLPVLSAIFLFFLHLNYLYYISGTIAFVLTLAAFQVYLRIVHPIMSVVVGSAFTVLLFWWAGPVAFLFAMSIILWQLLSDRKHLLAAFIPLALAVILAFASVKLAWVGDYKQIFLPTLYFHPRLTPPPIIYYPWLLLLLTVLFSFLWKGQKTSEKNYFFIFLGQLGIACIAIYFLLPIYGQFSSAQYKKLDYYARMERWGDIIEESKKPISNLLYAYYLNIALMETGQLGKQFLQFDQKGVDGLIPTSGEKGIPYMTITNDLYFTLGDIAASQYFTFDANVVVSKTGSPRLYKRLVQTNLIYGAYNVAEKYINLLEKTHYYKDWATGQRRFLYNDRAVEDDPLLGKKRKGLPSENVLIMTSDVIYRMQLIAESDPTNKAVIEYLASIFLFAKETTLFIELIDKYYHTEGTLSNLPEKFQEAIIIIHEKNPTEWERYNMDQSVVNKFRSYKQMLLKNRDNPDIAKMLYQNFGNTYWSYFLFNN